LKKREGRKKGLPVGPRGNNYRAQDKLDSFELKRGKDLHKGEEETRRAQRSGERDVSEESLHTGSAFKGISFRGENVKGEKDLIAGG